MSKSSKRNGGSNEYNDSNETDVDNPKPPAKRRVSISHTDSGPGPHTHFDLFEAVTELADEFRGEECVTVRAPGYIRESIERYQAIQFTSSPPPLSVIGCAAVYG